MGGFRSNSVTVESEQGHRALRRNRLATALQRVSRSAAERLRRARFLPKWLFLGCLIGLVAGIGAAVFQQVVSLATRLLSGAVAGYAEPSPAGWNVISTGAGLLPTGLAIPVAVGLGGLLSGILVSRIAPRSAGYGVNTAINAIHTDPRALDGRAVTASVAASAVVIGSGGNAARGGAAALLASGFGSLLARSLDLSRADGRIAVASGIGAGFAAILGTPAGGAILAMSIAYRNGYTSRAFLPGTVASFAGAAVTGNVEGFDPLFVVIHAPDAFSEAWWAWLPLLGVICGLLGLAFNFALHGVAATAKRMPIPGMVKPALGGLTVGLLGIAMPQVLGSGFGWIQHSLDQRTLALIPLWVVLTLPLAKVLATALTLGSGAPGGVLGPGMVIGGFAAAALWRLAELYHLAAPDATVLVMAGMAACIGAIARVPVAMTVIAAETTGSIGALAPTAIVVGISYAVVSIADQTIFPSQRYRWEATI